MVVQNQSELGEGSAIKPRKDTQVPQSSDPSKNVVDEAIHKELGDSLVRAATTASSLEAEQDSGGGPRCQETTGDTIAQTKFENVSKHSNDSLLARGSLKIKRLLLKRRVNKLEKKRSSRTHKLKRLYKLGLTARVESSRDEESLVRRCLLSGQNENVVEEVVDAAQVSTAATTVTITTEEITLAQALEALKTLKPKVKGIVFQEPVKFDEEERLAREKAEKETKPICQDEEWDDNQKQRLMLIINWLKDCKHKNKKTKRAKKKRNKSPTKAQQRQIMCTYLKNMEGYKLKDLKSKGFDSIQEMFDKAFKRVNTFEDFRTELVEGKENRAGEERYKECRRGKIDATPIGCLISKECHMLKSFLKENILEDLYKLVKARYGSTRPVESMDYLLWNDMKIMFEPHVEDEVWKLQQGYKVLEWKLYDSCGVQSLEDASMQIYMLVEKKYPLTPPTLSMMLERSFKLIMKVKWLISCVN
ncbi:hypothetical protein Tco_0469548 [Tanacetum coccineum]